MAVSVASLTSPFTNAFSVAAILLVTIDPQENFFQNWSPSSQIPVVLSVAHGQSRFSVILELPRIFRW